LYFKSDCFPNYKLLLELSIFALIALFLNLLSLFLANAFPFLNTSGFNQSEVPCKPNSLASEYLSLIKFVLKRYNAKPIKIIGINIAIIFKSLKTLIYVKSYNKLFNIFLNDIMLNKLK